jgi:hypothetical protein
MRKATVLCRYYILHILFIFLDILLVVLHHGFGFGFGSFFFFFKKIIYLFFMATNPFKVGPFRVPIIVE